jgi:hypothetical protein
MRFIDRAKLDLQEIKKGIASGITGFIFHNILWGESINFRNNLITAIQNAIEAGDENGDDALYELYQKGVNELWLNGEWINTVVSEAWISVMASTLKKTLNDIEKGIIQRCRSQDLLALAREENKNLQLSNQNLKVQVCEMQKKQPDFTDVLVEEGNILTGSLIIDFEHIVHLTKNYRYSEVYQQLQYLEQRCFQTTSSDIEQNVQQPIAHFIKCKDDISAVIAEQILTALRRRFPACSSLSTFFKSNKYEYFYFCLKNELGIYAVNFIIAQTFRTEEDLMRYIDILEGFICEYSELPIWNENPASCAKTILKRSSERLAQDLVNNNAVNSQSQLSDLNKLKEIRNILMQEIAQLKAAFRSNAKTTLITQFINNKSQEIICSVFTSPIEYVMKLCEMYISPATVVAKDLGRAYCELEHYKKQQMPLQSTPNENYKLALEQLENIIQIIDKIIETLEGSKEYKQGDYMALNYK